MVISQRLLAWTTSQERERWSFSFYQDNFSWGNGGKESTEAFERELQAFPNEIKEF